MTRHIMVIRHAEKPAPDGSVLGVDQSGSPDQDQLSVAGWQRAGALVQLFSGALGRSRLERPAHLFAPGATLETPSLRALSTLVPLSASLGLDVNTGFVKGEEAELVNAVVKLRGPVLVAWEYRAIVRIANLLMQSDAMTPQRWPEDCFDRIWVFLRSGSKWLFSEVPQMLLPGDASPATRVAAQRARPLPQ